MFSLEDASWVGMSGAQRKSSTMVLPRKYQMFPLSSPAKDKVKVNSRPTSNSEEVAQQNLMKLLIFDVNKNRDLERWCYVVVLSISRVWERGRSPEFENARTPRTWPLYPNKLAVLILSFYTPNPFFGKVIWCNEKQNTLQTLKDIKRSLGWYFTLFRWKLRYMVKYALLCYW